MELQIPWIGKRSCKLRLEETAITKIWNYKLRLAEVLGVVCNYTLISQPYNVIDVTKCNLQLHLP